MDSLNRRIKAGLQTGLAWGAIASSLITPLPSQLANASPLTKLNTPGTAPQQTLRYKPSNASSKLGDFSSTGAPRKRGSAGSRGECLQRERETEQQLPSPTALVPLAKGTLDGQTIDVPFGLTTRSHPTFWYQFPQNRDAIQSLDLTLVDETTQELVQEISDIPRQNSPHSETWSVQWPETAVALEVNRTYRWFLVIQCEGMTGSGTLLSGLIRREALPDAIAQSSPQASLRERAFLFAENGIWHEAIDELHRALDQSPDDSSLRDDWNSLLDSVGL